MRRLLTACGALFALVAGLTVTAPPANAETEPGPTGVYAGMYSSQWEATVDLEAMTSWAGKKVTFAGTFHSVFESESPYWSGNTVWILEHAWQAEATPVANLSIPASAAAIAAGTYDTAITAWATRVRTWTETPDEPGRPQRTLFIAPLQEQNGTWTPYGCDPANFRLAYARIRSLVRGVGLDETRVRWVWAPNGWTSTTGACAGTTLADYYPGADIVDVIGYSAYRWNTESVAAVAGGVADALRAIDATKPYLLLQTAAGIAGSGDQWIRDLFSWAASDPNMVGVVWFNFPNQPDWRVWNSTSRTGLSTGWRDALSASATDYAWPLTGWFQSGALTLAKVPTAPVVVPPPVVTIDIRKGARGAVVTQLQNMLNTVGFWVGRADGIFGSMTQAGVSRFQGSSSLPQTGWVDGATWTTLLAVFNTPPPPPVVVPPPAVTIDIRRGARGAVVTQLQTMLNTAGFWVGRADGIFGSMTQTGVSRFQASHSLPQTGWVDGATWTALVAVVSAPPVVVPPPVVTVDIRRGARGAVVSQLQTMLNAAGFWVGRVDGIFGSMTQAGVSGFQAAKSLPQTGWVDQATWDALVAAVA
jgi:peptidoglycan hydrolase-like protein with peptidoglycan-binding domain